MNPALLLIDIQNDYFKGGGSELDCPEKAAEQARLVLEHFRSMCWPVIHIQHINPGADASFFFPDTWGARIHESVAPLPSEVVVVKHRPNAFLNTGLRQLLLELGIDRVVVCGMMTHMCIDTTVRAASDLGVTVTLLQDSCATKALRWDNAVIPADMVHRAFLAALNGKFARVMTAEAFLSRADG